MRVLLLNAGPEADGLVQIVERLGHEIADSAEADGAGEADLAVLRLDLSEGEALDLFLAELACPVVAIVSPGDPRRAAEVATRGVFACLPVCSDAELADALEITLARFAEYHRLHGAFAARAVVGQATGILMAHHRIDADLAAAMLARHAIRLGEGHIDLAAAVIRSYRLLASTPPT